MMQQKNMTHYPDSHHGLYSKTVFGFWLYLITDFMMFGTLFAAYAVLKNNTYGGIGAKDAFSLSHAFIQTLFIITCAFTAGIASSCVHRREKGRTLIFLALTFIFGVLFLLLQFQEFQWLIEGGNSWRRSAFLTAYFTLVGTLAAHIIFALIWTVVFMAFLIKQGTHIMSIVRVTCLRAFWQFISIVWAFIFMFVYLMGAY